MMETPVQPFEIPGNVERYAGELQELVSRCDSAESVASGAVELLYKKFVNTNGDNDCVLMRFFRTMHYSDLLPDLQKITRDLLGYEPASKTNCLTLLASRGIDPAWNERRASRNHQVIPLLSANIIEQAPMVSQLIRRLGIDVMRVVEPNPTMFMLPEQKRYDVMFAPDASSEREVFNQSGFVEPFGVKSVIGCGTLLPTGDMFALLMFMRVHVHQDTAMEFQVLARTLESAINKLPPELESKGNILMAVTSKSGNRLINLLKDRYSLILASTTEEAIAQIDRENFSMIICDQAFDDSRMFELLIHLKKDKRERTKPFICYKGPSSQMGEHFDQAAFSAAAMFGAVCYIDGVTTTDADLMQTLQTYLPKKIWNAAAMVS